MKIQTQKVLRCHVFTIRRHASHLSRGGLDVRSCMLPCTSGSAANTADTLGPSVYFSCCEGRMDFMIFFSLLM